MKAGAQHQGRVSGEICSAILGNVDELCSLSQSIIQQLALLFNSERLTPGQNSLCSAQNTRLVYSAEWEDIMYLLMNDA